MCVSGLGVAVGADVTVLGIEVGVVVNTFAGVDGVWVSAGVSAKITGVGNSVGSGAAVSVDIRVGETVGVEVGTTAGPEVGVAVGVEVDVAVGAEVGMAVGKIRLASVRVGVASDEASGCLGVA